LQEKII